MKTLLISFFALASATAHAADEGFKEVKSGNMTLQWKVDGKNLQMKVRAKSDGWVGVGLNPSKGMKDAMFVIGAEKDGKVKVENHFGTGERAHTNYKDLGCKETLKDATGKRDGDFTEFSFTLPIDASDKCSKPLALDKEQTVLLAYGSRKALTASHPYVGKLKVNFTTGDAKPFK